MPAVIIKSPWGRGTPVTNAVLAASMWVKRYGSDPQAGPTCSHCGAGLTRTVVVVDGADWGLDCASTAGHVVDRRTSKKPVPPYRLTAIDVWRMEHWAADWEIVQREFLAGTPWEATKPMMSDPRKTRPLWELAANMSR